MKRISTALLLLASLCPSLAVADETVEEHRYHSRLADGSGNVIGHTTTILLWEKTRGQTIILYRSSLGDEFVIEDSTDYEKRTMEWIIRTTKGDAYIARRSEGSLYVSKTREGALEEFRERMDARDLTPFTTMRNEAEIETNGGSWRVRDEDFEGEARLRVTMNVRRAVPFHLLEMIERAADGILAESEEAILPVTGHLVAEFVLYETHCARTGLTYVEIPPDCGFDDSFGFPCSEKQKARTKRIWDEGLESLRY